MNPKALSPPKWFDLSAESKLRIEFIALFLLMPAFAAALVYRIPLFVFLFSGFLYTIWVSRKKIKTWRKRTPRSFSPFLKSILVRFFLGACLIAAFAWIHVPDRLFILVREQPWLILLIGLFYPFLSVIPQEFIYRTFFFDRYQRLFPSPRIMIAASSICFSFMHLVYRNPEAIILSLMGGVIFSLTYATSRSLAVVCIEHALYGLWIFLIGLGQFFYLNMFKTVS